MDSFSLVPYGANDKHCAVRFAAGKRDEEFWFEDGTVALTARDVAFKVFKSPLAEHSPVFKDMFTCPQPELDDDSMCDGCPVVHIPDSPQDLRPFLKAMHDSR